MVHVVTLVVVVFLSMEVQSNTTDNTCYIDHKAHNSAKYI